MDLYSLKNQNKNPFPGFKFPVLSFIIPYKYKRYSSTKRIKEEIPKSTIAKKTVINATVVNTVIV
jgi:hypothetical protein